MQKRHLSETFINVLQNAREALPATGGNVFVQARCLEDQSVEVCIRDDGPGIPPEKLGRIFEAYYTTKDQGIGPRFGHRQAQRRALWRLGPGRI